MLDFKISVLPILNTISMVNSGLGQKMWKIGLKNLRTPEIKELIEEFWGPAKIIWEST